MKASPFPRCGLHFLLTLGALCLVWSAPAARAVESLVVTTTVDEDNGTSDPAAGAGTSLREAINRANTDGVNSAITFSATAFAAPRKTIVLNGTALPALLANNGIPISITAPAAGVEISGNNASRIFFVDHATVTLTGLTLRNGNATGDFGGALYNSGGLLVMDSCTLTANTADFGGAIATNGFFAGGYPPNTILRNCTISGNSAGGDGGGVYTLHGPILIDSCTITQNAADILVNHTHHGGGVFGDSSEVNTMVRNSIIAANTASFDPDDVALDLNSQGYNLIGTGSGASSFTATGDQVIGTGAPGLGPLADNGGRTPTHGLLSDSPARDTGNTDLVLDQRGLSRPQGFADDKGAVEFPSTSESLVVTTTADEDNGTSDPAQGAGTSLREAINFANVYGGNNAITFSATAFAAPRKTITLNGTQLTPVTATLSITAPAAGVQISANNLSRVFQVNPGANVTLTGLTITNGHPDNVGGGIINGGALLLSSCTLSGNFAAAGSAIYSITDLTTALALRNCTISGNTATQTSAAVFNAAGLTTIESSTITGNSAPAGGSSGVLSFGSNTTRTEVRNSIISGNTTTDVDFAGGAINSFQSNGYNLIGDGNATADFNQTGDVTGNSNPGLAALAENGGPTPTRALLLTSPAFNTGNTNLAVDQRGVTRPQNGADDKGAFELVLNESLVVTTTADEDDGTSDPSYGAGTSLREALKRANADGVNSAITFSATAFAAPRKTITLSQFPPILTADGTLSITAPAAGVEISGNNSVELFINAGNTTMTGLTIRNGKTNFRGGAIQNAGSLLLDSCSLINNTAPVGGAISSQTNLSGTTLTLRNCTLTGNTATTAGGALYNLSGLTVIESSTLAGNIGPANAGSGVASVADNNTITVVTNSIIAANSNGDVDFVFGSNNSFQSNGSNLIGDGNATADFNVSTDQIVGNAAPGLKPLADNGGRTPTLALLPDSLAVNAGNTTLAFDQRGVSRPRGIADDIGAFELVIVAINPATLPSGRVGQVYSATTLFGSGGTSPYAFSLSSGYLPPGLTLTSTGQLSGTPRSAGVYPFTVQVNDSAAGSGERDYSITIAGLSAQLAEAATVWYRAEGDANSFSGPGANIVGNVTFTAGQTGQAFSFAGDGGYVALSPGVFPFPTTGTSAAPFSFETWFATTEDGVILGQQNVAPFSTTSGAVPAIYVGIDGKLRVEFFWNGSITQITTAGVVNEGAFHHVAAVYNGSTVTAYLDGVSFGSHAFTETAYAGPHFYQLGTGLSASRPSTPGGWFNFSGLIDEAAVYSHALSATEVATLYAAGQKGKSTKPFFTAMTKSGSEFTLAIKGWPALRFQLQHSEQLLSPTWTNVGAAGVTNAAGDIIFDVDQSNPPAESGFFHAVEVP